MTLSDIAVNYKPVKERIYFDGIPEHEVFRYKKKRMRRLALSQIKTYLKKAKMQPIRRSVYIVQINWVILHESLLKIAQFNFLKSRPLGE